MAGLKDSDDFKDGEFFRAPFALKLICLILGVGGTLLFILLALILPEKAGAMGYSWLFAVVFFLSLGIGGLFWTLLHHATNSGWGTVVRRLMENLAGVIPVMLLLGLLLLIPQFGFRDTLWEWFPKREAALKVAEEKASEELETYVADHESKVKKEQAKLEAANSARAMRQ